MEEKKYIYRGSVDELRAEMECLRDDNPEGWQASGGARVSWKEWPPPRVSTRATWIVEGAGGHAVMDAYQKKPRQTEVVFRDGCDLVPITYRKRPAEPMGPVSEEFTQMLAKELKLASIEGGAGKLRRPTFKTGGSLVLGKEKKAFRLGATPETFVNWLQVHTKGVWTREFPFKGGYCKLRMAHYRVVPGQPSLLVTIDGYYIGENDDEEVTRFEPFLDNAITFEIMRLDPERIKVIARCNSPPVVSYFRELLAAIAADWPEVAEQPRAPTPPQATPAGDGAGSRGRFNYVNRNEWTITVEDKSLGDLRLILENLARQLEEKCSPVMLVGPLMGQGTTDWALYYVPEKTRQTKRIPDYSDRGLIRVKEIPDGGGLAISFKAGEFPPVSHLFRQTLDDLSMKLGVSTPLPTEKPTPGQYVFRKSGEAWEIAYEGKRIPPLKDIYGLNYIGHVLAHPHRQFDLGEVEMAAKKSHPDTAIKPYAEEGLDGVSDGGVDYEILDSQAMSEYRERLSELVEERKEAERLGDAERLQKIDEETEDIEKQLRAATGLGGRKRKFPSERERARQRVQKAIKLAIDKIGEHDSALAEHLRSAIRTGRYYCSYMPDPSMGIEWEV